MPFRTLNVCILSFALLCIGMGQGAAESDADTDASAQAEAPLSSDRCWFDLDWQERDGRTITCGYLYPLEDWYDEESRQISLPIVKFGARNGDATGEPIVFLLGGPNQRASLRDGDNIQSFWIDMLRKHVWADRHDVIVITPRGANWSDSNLECLELRDPRIALGAAGHDGGQVDWRTTYLPAHQACVERLRQVHDLHGYSLDQMMHDVVFLQERLELDAWSLMGVSFGTRLALEVMRQEPPGLQKVVLDSVLPPGIDPVRGTVAGIDRALKKVFAACSSDESCRQDYPDLETFLPTIIDTLDTGHYAWFSDTKNFGDVYFDLRTSDFWYTIAYNMYDPESVSSIPSILEKMANEDMGPIRQMIWGEIQPPYVIPNAAFELVNCNMFFDDFEDVEWQKLEAEFPLSASVITDFKEMQLYCQRWPLVGQHEDEEAAVTSAIPTLLLTGEFDAVTPPEDAKLVAQTLENAHLFVFEDQAHAVVNSSPCAAAVTTAFLQDPSTRPEIDCSVLDRKIHFKPRTSREEGN